MRGQVGERGCLLPQVLEVGVREGTVTARRGRPLHVDPDQLAGPVDRQRFQQHRVDDAEDRSVGPDAERKHDDRRRAEAGMLQHHAYAVAQVLEQVFDVAEGEDIATLFLDHLRAPQTGERHAARLFRRHAPADVLLDIQLQVRLQFRVELALDALATEQIHQANGGIS